MLKNNFMRLLTAVFVLMVSHSYAQTIVWGTGSANLNSDTIGRFALPWGSGANAWTAVSIWHGNASNCAQVTPGASFWTRSTAGRSFGAYWNNRPVINSPSMTDGVALFDSDFLDNNGTTTFNSGTAPSGYNCGGTVPGQRGELHSPTFDLTGYTDSTLNARFYLYYRPFQLAELSLGFSTDNGATWTDFDITQGIAANNDFAPAWVEMPLFGVLTGVSNLTQCKIRLTFQGYYYFAMLDDLSLRVAPDYDFAISTQTAGNTLGDAFTTSYTSDYRYSPITQQDTNNYFFTARVTNLGAKTILPANNARIEYLVEKSDGAGGWIAVYSDSIAVDTVAPQGLVTPGEVFLPNYNFIDTFGVYRGTLIAVHDLADGKTSNDTLRHTFDITEGHFSKCRQRTDGNVYANRPIFPGAGAGNVITEFEYGSMFFFPRGAADSVVLDSVNYRVYAPTTLVSGFTAAPINLRVYEFNDVNGDGNLDAVPTAGELTLVGLGIDTVNLTAGQYSPGTTNILDINTFGTLSLKDNTVYFVTLDQRNAQGLSTSGQYRCAWYGADELNYAINAAVLSNGTRPRNPSPVRVAEANSTTFVQASNDWNWVGFGADIQPSIRLMLSGNLNPWAVVNPNGVIAQTDLAATMDLFPNPTANTINLKVAFDTEVANATYMLSSINGQVLEMVVRNNIQQEVYSFDVHTLPAGVYFISVRTEKGVKTQRFVKE